MKPTDFAIRLKAFLSEYMAGQRNMSPNTIKSYRDTFILLIRYFLDKKGISPEKIHLDAIDAPLIIDFLGYLEKDRNCGALTRNHRLSGLHAFFRYVQLQEPERLVQCQRILSIPCRRYVRLTVDYLSVDDMAAILAQPDITTIDGRRDAVLLSVLYDTGARVQELIDLSVQDIRLSSPSQIRLYGKGGKIRIVPILSGTVNLLNQYLKEHELNHPEHLNSPLFQNHSRKRLTRSGIRHILLKYVEKSRENGVVLPRRISPHIFRHYGERYKMVSDCV